ncbi:MAG: glycosyltransferase family 2 protein [Candidatus Coatesbacteria bacterium]|nr:MAG: glycosyltransferase family 2 protein [Candidatus Coatesbacteria bacterium]
MITFFEIAALVCLGSIVYHYAGYPILLWILNGRRKVAPPESSDGAPSVSVIVPCYNEADVIVEKVAAVRAEDYDGPIEVIVSSDGSDDGTETAAEEAGATVVHSPERRGKVAALNAGVEAATGEILVFSDANAMLAPNAMARLAAWFADPRVGAVAGEQVIVKGGDGTVGAGESVYWRYEAFIKGLEAARGTALCADGSLYAVRKDLYEAPPSGVLLMDDFYISGAVVRAGYKIAYAPDAVAYEGASVSAAAEFKRKARILAGSLVSTGFLGPRFWFRVPFKLFSHKVLRWFGPWLGLGALVFSSAAVVADSYAGGILFGLQFFFYLAALFGWAMRGKPLPFPFKAAYYLTLSNLAVLWGYVVLITQLKRPAWEKLR